MPTDNPLTIQQIIEQQLCATHRQNVDGLVAFLRSNGYFTAHCHRHHHFEGGTAQHCLETLFYALSHNTANIPTDRLVVVCLLHDICDVRGFRHHEGHGRRSCKLITQEACFSLHNDEYQAIMHHMHSTRDRYKFGTRYDEVTQSPLWKLLREADYYSAGHPMSRHDLVRNMQSFTKSVQKE